MNKEDATHTHNMQDYSAARRKEILPFGTAWMDLKGIMLSKMSQKDKYCMELLICGIKYIRVTGSTSQI